ncbi:MAG: molecular chaperone DnaJ [Clostridiales bacterium]|jgi:DnaJ-class molecular chaperone|nr:molecular chaperone DnaJ [Clostridiales bacterium]MDN5283418.1 molecular chaperone DnaJ [Candidatus Ozemobacter sp.]
MKDYYKTLEVSQSASKEEIKKSFKRLAKKYHPDINKGDKKAEEKFKEISEAYEVLGRDDERAKYDAARTGRGSFKFEGFSKEGPFGDFFYSSSGSMGGSDFFEEILKSFGGFGSRSSQNSGSPFSGFEGLFGGRGGKSSARGANASLKVPLSTAIKGGKVSVSGLPGGSQTVTIPANTPNGHIINVDTYQGAFRLKIEIEDEYPFKIKGHNIETTISINLAQAIMGSKIKLKGPRGDDFIVTVPPGSQNGDILRLRRLGLGGDLLVKLEVTIPKDLNEEQKNAFRELAEKMGWKY